MYQDTEKSHTQQFDWIEKNNNNGMNGAKNPGKNL